MNKEGAWRARLEEAVDGAVAFDVPMAKHVAFRIGGPAEALVKAKNATILQRTLGIAKQEAVPVTILGTGSNVLVSDRGICGVTIRLSGELADIHVGAVNEEQAEFEVGCGALNAKLVAMALGLGYVGLEFLATVPGTLGGALMMNAGAHGSEIGSFVQWAKVLTGVLQLETRSNHECGFAYRNSAFASEDILISASLVCSAGDTQEARAKLKEMRAKRRATQPTDLPNAGSIFKNPAGDFAARLIEDCGLKGFRIGDAMVSKRHANFIVNTKSASAHDVVLVAKEMRARVEEKFGICLEWEVKRIGQWSQEGCR